MRDRALWMPILRFPSLVLGMVGFVVARDRDGMEAVRAR
jgi:hypothetical protein